MVVGNFAALRQSNVKRLLAYSSIAHAGYVLVAVTAASDTGVAAAMFYLAAYAAMNLGAFAVVIHIAGKGERRVRISDLAGLGTRQPRHRGSADGVPALVDRSAAHRWLLRQSFTSSRRPWMRT